MTQTTQSNTGTSKRGAARGAGNSTPDGILRQTEDFTREEPLQAVAIAFVAGLILTLLPIGSIIAGLARLSLALVRPALLVLGAVKAYEEFNQRQHD